jgi:resuscitation-promoting factor RpfB
MLRTLICGLTVTVATGVLGSTVAFGLAGSVVERTGDGLQSSASAHPGVTRSENSDGQPARRITQETKTPPVPTVSEVVPSTTGIAPPAEILRVGTTTPTAATPPTARPTQATSKKGPPAVAAPPATSSAPPGPTGGNTPPSTLPTTPPVALNWDAVARCESGGNWSDNTGNGYYGGLQFGTPTWLSNGGGAYAPRADLATKAQQIDIANHLYAARGAAPWPTCGTYL